MHTVFVLTFPRHWLCLCVCVTVKCVVFLCVLNCIGMLIRWNRISINGQGSSCKEQGGNPVISPLVHHTYIVSQGIMVGSCPISCQRANSMPRFWSPSKKMCFSWCIYFFLGIFWLVVSMSVGGVCSAGSDWSSESNISQHVWEHHKPLWETCSDRYIRNITVYLYLKISLRSGYLGMIMYISQSHT